jgi:hypothetical protein
MEYTITLDGKEIELAQQVGEKRQESNIAWGSENQRASPKSDLEINISGFAGEIAFARLFEVDLDMGDTHRVHDTTLHGTTVDVKTFQWGGADLLVPFNKKDKQCEIYVLMVGKLPTLTFAGWATNHDVFDRTPEKYPLERINFVVRRHELRLPEDLFAIHPEDLRQIVQ